MLSTTVRNHEAKLETATQNLANLCEAIPVAQSKYDKSKADCNDKKSKAAKNYELYVTAKGVSHTDYCLATASARFNARMTELSALQDHAVRRITLASQDLLSLEDDLVNMKRHIVSVQEMS